MQREHFAVCAQTCGQVAVVRLDVAGEDTRRRHLAGEVHAVQEETRRRLNHHGPDDLTIALLHDGEEMLDLVGVVVQVQVAVVVAAQLAQEAVQRAIADLHQRVAVLADLLLVRQVLLIGRRVDRVLDDVLNDGVVFAPFEHVLDHQVGQPVPAQLVAAAMQR